MIEAILAGVTIGATVTGVIAAALNTRNRRIKKKIRKAPFKRIAMIEDGETVTIAGNIVFHEKFIKAPLTNRECVYYRTTVEKHKSSGKNSKWVKVIDEAASVDFLLDDGDRMAIVEANAIEGILDMDSNNKSGSFKPATPIMEQFLRKYMQSSKGLFGFNFNMRFKEGALEKHEYCVVCGTCYWENAEEHGIENAKEVLVIRANDGQPVYISDKKDILI